MAQKTKKRKKKLTKRQRQKKRLIRILVILALAIVLAIGLGVWYFWSMLQRLDRTEIGSMDDTEVNDLTQGTHDALRDFTTIAVFGLDNTVQEGFERGNSDTIIVAALNNRTKEIRMVSVLRDTYLQMQLASGRTAYRKANAAYSNGGVKNAVNMLNVNLDLDISNFVAVNFESLAEVVDQLGGIEITIDQYEALWMRGYQNEVGRVTGKEVHYLAAGTHNMDGVQAVAYARVRYGGGDDPRRTERQRLVIERIMEKATRAGLPTINRIANNVLPKISTSLSDTEILGLLTGIFSFHIGESASFPFTFGTADVDQGTIGVQNVVVAGDLVSNVEQLHQFLYGAEAYTPSTKLQAINQEIINNTGIDADSPGLQTPGNTLTTN